MHFMNHQTFKIIITDESGTVSRGIAGFYIPIPNNEDGDDTITEKEIEDATNFVKEFFEREFSKLDELNSDSDEESEDDFEDEYNWTPNPSPIPVIIDDLDDDLIDEEELRELIAILDKIVQINPNLLDDPRPIIGLDVYKFGSYLAGSDEFTWEFEYCIHDDPSAYDDL